MIIDSLAAALLSGLALGFSAGVSPGPLLTLVVTETLAHSVKSGFRVAMAPLITDPPVIALALLLVGAAARLEPVMGGVALAGAVFLAYLAWESFTCRGAEVKRSNLAPKSLRKGVLTNLLSPNPWLYWLSVGGPLLVTSWRELGLAAPALHLLGFYACLVGAKVCVAWLTDRFSGFLRSSAYVWTMRLMGAALAWFALQFLLQGLRLIL